MDAHYNSKKKSIFSCSDCNVLPNDSDGVPSRVGGGNGSGEIMKQTDHFLASEMNKLSVEERSNALNDLHCVGEELKETPEMVEQALVEFEQVVQEEKTNVYEMAIQQNQSFVQEPSFRLTFLRSNLYDVRQSVRKMMNLLRYKALYFGNDKIGRDITLDDLNEDDMELMLSGLYHIQEGRDRTGRIVVYLFSHLMGHCRADTVVRDNAIEFMIVLESAQCPSATLFSDPSCLLHLVQHYYPHPRSTNERRCGGIL